MSHDPTGLVELTQEAYRLSKLLDQGLEHLRGAATDVAAKEAAYRRARAIAWQHTTGTAKEREDLVNAETATEREARDAAENFRLAALESVRSRRVQITMCQTLVNAHRGELELATYGPREAVA